jgi:paraquat-inducible protein A
MRTAAEQGLANCHVCGKLSQANAHNCSRCGANIHLRKPNSLHRVSAFLITACILYIPANVLPITITTQLGQVMESTIIGSVIHLWEQQSYPVAFVIFFASIVIPIAKIIALFWLCWSVFHKHNYKRKERARLFRITEFVGRWSMIDVFVVAILVALIQLGGILTIQPGSAALAFAGVVMITMFAAFAFDPRLIWDTKTFESGSQNNQYSELDNAK